MAKIVRLTESDLTRLVRRVIEEQKVSETDCYNYSTSKGLQYLNDGGNDSSWFRHVNDMYSLTGIIYEDGLNVFLRKTGKFNDQQLPLDKNLINTITSLATSMGGKLSLSDNNKCKVAFPLQKCKQMTDFSLKLINLLKQSK
jgi:hypothetical protein